MKKLLVIITVVAMSACAQAATVAWSMTAIGKTPDGNSAKAGWVGYFMDASTYATFAALDASQVASYAAANKLYDATTVNNRGINISKSSGSYKAGDEISGYIVIFNASAASDATYYAYTKVQSTTIAAGGADGSIGFGTFTSAMGETGSSGGWQSVPEPTSAMLMLLGMAGLALRRRRA